MATLVLGDAPLTIEQISSAARATGGVSLSEAARARIARGRAGLEALLAQGTRIYGVNTGVGGNVSIELDADQSGRLQDNLMRHLSCATGPPLPGDVVRAAILLRIATFATGCSGVRTELVEALARLFASGVTPVVPRYGSVGASGDLMPSAYIARVLIGMGEAELDGRRMPAAEALRRAGLEQIQFAPKEGLALINGTTVMTAAACLLWVDGRRVLDALLAAIALSLEALEAPAEPFEPFVHIAKGHPGQIAVAGRILSLVAGSRNLAASRLQSSYALRCPPQGLGPVWEALDDARPVIEREINSANDNPLIDPDSGRLYLAGNFYGGHIARLLDGWKLDYAVMANWANSLMAVLVDHRFNRGLPANLVAEGGVNSGFKGMQLSLTSLTCAVRQMAGPSLIHSLPTEQYNQDVVSLGMHAAVTAMDALECLRNATAMILLAAAQAVELRGGEAKLGVGSRRAYQAVRSAAAGLERDRPMEGDIAAVAALIAVSGVA
jgi:phenylalanine ammonia-lyase